MSKTQEKIDTYHVDGRWCSNPLSSLVSLALFLLVLLLAINKKVKNYLIARCNIWLLRKSASS